MEKMERRLWDKGQKCSEDHLTVIERERKKVVEIKLVNSRETEANISTF